MRHKEVMKVGGLSKGRTEEMGGWGVHCVGIGCPIPGPCSDPLRSAVVNPRETKLQGRYVKVSRHTRECVAPKSMLFLLLGAHVPPATLGG